MIQFELLRYVITDDLLTHTYPWRVSHCDPYNITWRKVWPDIIDWCYQSNIEYIGHYGNCEFWFRSEEEAVFFLLRWNQ